jgi:hypothetical protein
MQMQFQREVVYTTPRATPADACDLVPASDSEIHVFDRLRDRHTEKPSAPI